MKDRLKVAVGILIVCVAGSVVLLALLSPFIMVLDSAFLVH